ncbi:hypothetical protein ABTE60_20910, partial [Acinetobacter baumannii]
MKDPLLTSLRRQLKAEAPVVPAAKPATASIPARPEPELSDEALFAQATKGAKRMETAAPPPRAQKPRKPDAMTLLRRAQ